MISKNFFTKLLLFLFIFFSFLNNVYSQENQQTSDLRKKIEEYQNKLIEIRQQKNTLSSQIQYMDTQIYLTNLKIIETEQKIEKTEKEINTLETKIEDLDSSLNYLSKLLINKIIQSYKQKNFSLLDIFFQSENANNLMNKIKYIKIARDNNQKLIVQVQKTKINFEEQKNLREEKKKELDNLKIILARQQDDLKNQKLAKQKLLADTQNSEVVYQNLLAKAQSEYAAIQGIIAGAGIETKIKEVKKGDIIATIISGPSCNSSGSHLHFMVKENDSVQNPFNYLKNINYINYSNDPWTPSGSWDWPIEPTVEFYQGYGYTWAINNTWVGSIYRFHNGIDIFGSSYNVYAVDDGVLYRGNYPGINCSLPYVKLVHKNSNISTYYLHTYLIN
ncbi:MAG: hypothetical protein NZM02_02310 [Patescibacteria group bacterium]|nr:hypothetical protein [Patescibacteria group bacterium]